MRQVVKISAEARAFRVNLALYAGLRRRFPDGGAGGAERDGARSPCGAGSRWPSRRRPGPVPQAAEDLPADGATATAGRVVRRRASATSRSTKAVRGRRARSSRPAPPRTVPRRNRTAPPRSSRRSRTRSSSGSARAAAAAAARARAGEQQAVKIDSSPRGSSSRPDEAAKAAELGAQTSPTSSSPSPGLREDHRGRAALKAATRARDQALDRSQRPARHLDRPVRSRTRLPRSRAFTQADSEFDRCIKRRARRCRCSSTRSRPSPIFPPVYYYQGRVRDGLKSAGFAESVPDLSRHPRKRRAGPAASSVRARGPHASRAGPRVRFYRTTVTKVRRSASLRRRRRLSRSGESRQRSRCRSVLFFTVVSTNVVAGC